MTSQKRQSQAICVQRAWGPKALTEMPAFMRPACWRDCSMMAFTSGFGDAFRLRCQTAEIRHHAASSDSRATMAA